MKLVCFSASLLVVFVAHVLADPNDLIDTLTPLVQESINRVEFDEDTRQLFKKKSYGYGKGVARPTYTKKAPVRPVYAKKTPVAKAPVCHGKGCGRYLLKKKSRGFSVKGKVARPTYSKSFVRPAYTKKAPVRPVYNKKAPVAKAPVCFGKGCGRYLFKKKARGYGGKGKVVRPTYSKSFVRPAYTKKTPVYNKKAPMAKSPACFGKGCGRYLFKKQGHGYSGKFVRPTYSKSFARPTYSNKAPPQLVYGKKAHGCHGKACPRF